MKRNALILGSGALLLSVAGSLSVTHAEDGQARLEEVIVTAQKRAQDVMEVPISITALGSGMIESANITSTNDLQNLVPGLEIRNTGTGVAPVMRGIGSRLIVHESAVPIFVDGIYQSLPSQNYQEFNNLQSIEVLKGPQGTLFGRNATGGIVHFITKDPQREASGWMKVGYGNYETSKVNGYFTTGIGDTLAADLSLIYKNQSKGYSDNVFTDEDVNKLEDYVAVRSKWLWTPTDATEIRLTGDYRTYKGNPTAHAAMMQGTVNLVGVPALDDYFDVQNNVVRGVNSGSSKLDGEEAFGDSLAFTLRVDHEFSRFNFVSLSGYIDQEAGNVTDLDGSPFAADAYLTTTNEQFSQEFQLLSRDDSSLTWVGGLYFLRAEHSYAPIRLTGLASAPSGFSYIDARNTVTTTSYAGFFDMTYAVNDKLRLTGGVRWSYDKKELEGASILQPLAGRPPISLPFDESKDWDEPTYRAVIEYSFTPDVMTYVSYSHGYRSGSWNNVITNGVVDPPVDPEFVDSYEIGLKSELLNRTLSLSAAAYYMEFTDMQVNQDVGGTSLVRLVNAAESEIKGLELESKWSPLQNLFLRAALTYTDAEFTSFPGGPINVPRPTGGNASSSTQLKGYALPRSPKYTASVGVDHSLPVAFGRIDTSVNLYYSDSFYWQPDNRIKENPYKVLNGRITWISPSETYEVAVWSSNLTDEEYAAYVLTDTFGDRYAPAPPRTYGVEFRWNFL